MDHATIHRGGQPLGAGDFSGHNLLPVGRSCSGRALSRLQGLGLAPRFWSWRQAVLSDITIWPTCVKTLSVWPKVSSARFANQTVSLHTPTASHPTACRPPAV